MKLYKYSLALMLGITALTSCDDKLELRNPNRQTSATFGYTDNELEECVVAAYNHIRMEGTYSRVGYGFDMCRGDEVWNCSQGWYIESDDLTGISTGVDGERLHWPWRDWFYTINVCNFILQRTEGVTAESEGVSDTRKQARGQALFLRGLSYYNLAGYYQNPPIVTDYGQYESVEKMAFPSSTYDAVFDQVEADLKEAMTLLPKRDEGGEWAKGRATCGAAAGYYARALMQRHKYEEALAVLKDILSTSDGGNQKYGSYKLMANYGDNFREGSAYENNDESLFEVQFLDHGTQGADLEWTPVNATSNPTQGHAIESNCTPSKFGGWADLAASPWLYNLFKEEETVNNTLDPRLYWTVGTYEDDWENFEYGNTAFGSAMSATENIIVNENNGGLPIAKNTNFRTGLYSSVVTGLYCGINMRLMRYSDILLRAAECENEVNGPTQQAIDWINKVRSRAKLANLQLSDFADADALFEQIANVERPKEFGCEFGRGFDLIRWGFFYAPDRLQQLKEHGTFRRSADPAKVKDAVNYSDIGKDSELKSSYNAFIAGHEFLPIYQGLLDANANLRGNSANYNTNNATYHTSKGWTIHPVKK